MRAAARAPVVSDDPRVASTRAPCAPPADGGRHRRQPRYGQRFNPLYQSGTIVAALYLVLIVTGLWLILFYRVGAPWESVARIAASPWTGNWVRSLHRYASDLAVVATAVHALRMFAQGRSRGARTMAWTSGWLLLLLIMVCGWTGYVMVWDVLGQYLAQEGPDPRRAADALRAEPRVHR